MKETIIVNREMTAEEVELMNKGFDALSLEEGVETEGSDRIGCVALMEDKFIGGASGLAYKNGEDYSGWFFLVDLFVDKEHRSRGLGAKLLKTIEDRASRLGVKRIWLWTSGEKALKFYDRYGYEIFVEMEKWYSDGNSRVGLWKNL